MAKTNIWMPFYIGDYMAATTGLSTEQHGAYLLLLFAYWDNGGPLQDDDATLAQITRLKTRSWKQVRPVLERFFSVKRGRWYHRRVEAELGRVQTKSRKAQQSAAKRWMRTQCDGNANASNSHPSSICLEHASHSHSHSQKESVGNGVSQRIDSDYAREQGARPNSPTLSAALAHFEGRKKLTPECDYTPDEVKNCWLSFEASKDDHGQWYWGKRLVGDWRAAMESRMGDTRTRKPAHGKPGTTREEIVKLKDDLRFVKTDAERQKILQRIKEIE